MTDIFDKSSFTASSKNGCVAKDVLILSFVSSAWRISFETRTRRSRLSFIRGQTIFLDENLSWKSHISYICKKISKSAGIIFRSRFYLSTKTKLLLYYSLVYPYLTYCNPTWSSTYVTNLNRIFLIQKRIVHAITNAPYRAHSAPIFAQLKLLDIYKLNSFYTAKFMFSYIHSLLPPPFLHLFNRNNNFHNYNTRTASNYCPHICRTDIKQFTILYQGPKVWNSLPTDITNSESRLSFKKKILNLLINQYN